MEFDEPVRVYIERLKEELFVRTDEALAEEIGYSKQAIANWRRRENIPAKAEAAIIERLGPTFALDQQQRTAARRREKSLIFACSMPIFDRWAKMLDGRYTAKNLLILDDKYPDAVLIIKDHIRELMRTGQTDEEIVASFIDKVTNERSIELTWFYQETERLLSRNY